MGQIFNSCSKNIDYNYAISILMPFFTRGKKRDSKPEHLNLNIRWPIKPIITFTLLSQFNIILFVLSWLSHHKQIHWYIIHAIEIREWQRWWTKKHTATKKRGGGGCRLMYLDGKPSWASQPENTSKCWRVMGRKIYIRRLLKAYSMTK